jgi:hypothetical protein
MTDDKRLEGLSVEVVADINDMTVEAVRAIKRKIDGEN